jgi:hypothetical protein
MNKPKHFLMFKLIGFIGVAVAIIGLVLVITGFGDFTNDNFMIGGIMLALGFFVGFSCLTIGFRPELSRIATRSARYIQQENKEDLKEMASTRVEIHKDAITSTARAVKEGLKDTVFCKHCGNEIDVDSKYCRFCGKEQ